jgi:hypothetical protein
MPRAKLVKVCTFIDVETHKQLLAISRKTMIRIAPLLRKAIDNIIKEYK